MVLTSIPIRHLEPLFHKHINLSLQATHKILPLHSTPRPTFSGISEFFHVTFMLSFDCVGYNLILDLFRTVLFGAQ